MNDLKTRAHINTLVHTFYEKVLRDELIGHFFTEVAEIDFEKHMPLLVDFWETTLLGNIKYKGNPMMKHVQLNRKEAMLPEHFERWLSLWEETVNELFQGPNAENAIQRAKQIAGLLEFKVSQQKPGLFS